MAHTIRYLMVSCLFLSYFTYAEQEGTEARAESRQEVTQVKEKPEQEVRKRKKPKKPLTFLVYMAADNNLYKYVDDDLNEMMKVGSNDNINIAVFLNYRKPGGRKESKKLYIEKGKIIRIGREKAHDSGDDLTLIRASNWAHRYYPSDHFVLVLWDHGSGSLNRTREDTLLRSWLWSPVYLDATGRACCYDDTTGNYLTDEKLRRALSTICRQHRDDKKIDIIAFDACLMADIEVAFSVGEFANYLVSSQETIPGTGYGYDYVLSRAARGETDPQTFVANMISAYKKEYERKTEGYTLSAVDLSTVMTMVSNVNRVSQLLIEGLKSSDGQTVKQMITESSSPRNCTHFSHDYYIDLGHFYKNILTCLDIAVLNTAFKESMSTALQNGLGYLDQCIVANAKGTEFPEANGLSIYFDQSRIDSSYSSLYWSQRTAWYPLLKQYFITQNPSLLSILPV